jgi:hypothetical protein
VKEAGSPPGSIERLGQLPSHRSAMAPKACLTSMPPPPTCPPPQSPTSSQFGVHHQPVVQPHTAANESFGRELADFDVAGISGPG